MATKKRKRTEEDDLADLLEAFGGAQGLRSELGRLKAIETETPGLPPLNAFEAIVPPLSPNPQPAFAPGGPNINFLGGSAFKPNEAPLIATNSLITATRVLDALKAGRRGATRAKSTGNV